MIKNDTELECNASAIAMNALGFGLLTTVLIYLFAMITGWGRWLWKLSVFGRLFLPCIAASGTYLLIRWLLLRLYPRGWSRINSKITFLIRNARTIVLLAIAAIAIGLLLIPQFEGLER